MRKSLLITFLLSQFFLLTVHSVALPIKKEHKKNESKDQAKKYIESRPVEFLENKGQMTDMNQQPVPYVLYKAEAPGMDFYITEKGLTYVFVKSEERENEELEAAAKPVVRPINKDEHIKTEWNRIDMTLQGASIKKENIIAEGESKNFSQYFLPHCPDGITDVHSYKKITINNIYPNIDWVLYNSSDKGFKYDFVVHPGADYKQIELVYSSLSPLQLDKEGNIEIEAEIGTLKENAPVSFSGGKEIESQFIKILNAKSEKGGYDTKIKFSIDNNGISELNDDLIIDPQLNWATFFGGANFLEGSTSIAIDPSGNLFVAGYTVSTDFPTLDAGTFFQDSLAISNDLYQ